MNFNDLNFEKIKKYFASKPIEKAWLIGSYARGTQTSDSDVDILVKFDPEARIGLFMFSQIIDDLENIAKKNIDLVEEGTFYPWIEENVSKEKILIYERITS